MAIFESGFSSGNANDGLCSGFFIFIMDKILFGKTVIPVSGNSLLARRAFQAVNCDWIIVFIACPLGEIV
jgi:hypothetical protein